MKKRLFTLFTLLFAAVIYSQTTINIPVSSGNDDAEERANGRMNRNSSDLELYNDRDNQQIGIRFQNVTIPQGATVTNAYIQFTVDETNESGPIIIGIAGEDIDNSSQFTTSSNNISNRTKTSTTIENWSPANWAPNNTAGVDQRTPDLANIVQEIIDRSGWSENNAMTFILYKPSSASTTTNNRTAQSYNKSSSSAPVLHVEFSTAPPVAEIDIIGNGNSIASGDSTPSTTDNTDYGTVETGTTSNHVFTISNTSSGSTLNLSGSPIVDITGDTAFTVSTQPSGTSISGGNSLTYVVSFAPTTDTTVSATVSIANDDTDENPYTFMVQGTGFIPSSEIDITGNGNSIATGDITPSTSDDTDFGSLDINTGSVSHTFTIANTGDADLDLTDASPYVTIIGDADFTLTANPSTPITAASNTNFTITFDPTVVGTRTANISIANSDSDESPYTFDVQGIGFIPEPEIDITGSGVSIVDGDVTPSTTDYTDFGMIESGTTSNRTYTILNTSSGSTLNLSGSSLVDITGDTAFTVSTQPSGTSISGGNSLTYVVSFAPTTDTTVSATVSIANDDTDENPYTFMVQGTGFIPSSEIDITGNGNSIATGDITPSTSDDTDFGSLDINTGSVSHTFTIANTGDADLDLTDASPYVTITGDADFILTANPSTPIVAASNTSFTITFDPTVVGTRTANISIANSDSDENPYTFDIQGTGTNIPPYPSEIVAGDDWYYLHNVSDYESNWKTTINESWSSGAKELGYGDGDEATDLGQPATPRPITTCFRKYLTISDPSIYSSIDLEAVRDDGMVVFINGTEVWRDNMPTGTIGFDTTSSAVVGGTDEDTWQTTSIPSTSLVAGTNVIAVEVHQTSGTSSDISFNFRLTGVLAPASEIDITGNSTSIANGDTTPSASDDTEFGSVGTGEALDRTFTIDNIGGLGINLTGSPIVDITGDSAFSILTQPSETLISGGNSQTFVVRFSPTVDATVDAIISIANDDSDENPYTFTVQGTGVTPVAEIDILGNGVSIVDGDTTPSTSDDTDFGSVNISIPVSKTFTIENNGTASLSITSATSDNSDFVITSSPSATVAIGGSTTFDVQFSPSGLGGALATITIVNDDSDESPYTFTIEGTGVDAPLYPSEIVAGDDWLYLDDGSDQGTNWRTVSFDDSSWASGSAELGYGDGDEATTLNYGGDSSNKYITTYFRKYITISDPSTYSSIDIEAIRDDGMIVYLNGVEIWRDHITGSVNYTTLADSPAIGGTDETTWITANVANNFVAGTNVIAVEIHQQALNSSDLSFNFKLTGVLAPSSEIDITGNGTSIANGDSTPSTSDDTEFGSVGIGETLNRIFTIDNIGGLGINLTGSPIVDITGDSAFSILTQPSGTSISGGNSLTFEVSYSPTSSTTASASISIANDDSDENPYTFSVQGTGVTPIAEIDVLGNGVSIVDGDTTPSISDDTDFGSVNLSIPVSKTFTIENTGTASLSITSAMSDNSDFVITSSPSATVAIGGSTTVAIQFSPSGLGSASATITIVNDDSDENPFTFTIEGTGVDAPLYPSEIVAGDDWLYLDDGSNQGAGGAGWTAIGFDDSSWASGPAELGYGDGDEATTLSYGGNSSNKYTTTYFRKYISISNPSSYYSIDLGAIRDDAMVVYLNGTEIWRDNISANPVQYDDFSDGGVSGENTWIYTNVSNTLIAGTNVIAVEIHQTSLTSSDIGFDFEFTPSTIPPGATQVVRGPYLQKGTENSVVVRWRTETPTNTKVNYGTALGALTSTVSNGASVTDHEITLAGLSPNTTYYYEIEDAVGVYVPQDSQMYVKTHPVAGAKQFVRAWILGDAGTANSNQRNVRDAYYNYEETTSTNPNQTDMMLFLGDNAYNSGTDSEYQSAFYDIYDDMLKKSVAWSTLGNHDGYSAVSSSQTGPYYDMFTFPTAAEAGGLASGTEAYYSFDYANIHFIVLESYHLEGDATQHAWLENDIAATTQDWIVALFHHPAYTKGSHDSDSEGDLITVRSEFLHRLEDGGVDLVLSGHSHSYERSYFINGHYGLSGTFSGGNGGAHIVGSNGHLSGRDNTADGAYLKPNPAEGSVYITTGSAGKATGADFAGEDPYNAPSGHDAMYYSDQQLGSTILEVEDDGSGGQNLNIKFLTDGGVIDDYFTINKSFVASRGSQISTNEIVSNDLSETISTEIEIDVLKLYPNPVSDILNIQVKSSEEFNLIKFYNALGSKVKESSRQSVDVSNLKTGMYMVEIITDKTSYFKPVIIE